MKKLEFYLLKLNKDEKIKIKDYYSDCPIESANSQLIIIHIYDESTFLVNNSILQVCIKSNNSFL